MATEKLSEIPDVEIEPQGTFKYVLVKVNAPKAADGTEPSKMIVFGSLRGPNHGDIYDATTSKLSPLGLEAECVGGGRIMHSPEEKKINVYGFSEGFGKADHQLTVDLLKKKYVDYNITWSNDDL